MPAQYKQLFGLFFEHCEIPRGSGNRGPITTYLQEFAKQHGFACTVDAVSNVLIKVPATKGCENAPSVCL